MSINELKQELHNFFSKTEAKEVSLFGSFARGEEKEKSDIDLLVEFSSPVSLLKICHYKNQLEDLLGQKVDILTPASISDKIIPYIKKDLIQVYAK